VRVGEKRISDVVVMTIGEVRVFLDSLRFSAEEEAISRRIMQELRKRDRVP